jgi:hypothetical protein
MARGNVLHRIANMILTIQSFLSMNVKCVSLNQNVGISICYHPEGQREDDWQTNFKICKNAENIEIQP